MRGGEQICLSIPQKTHLYKKLIFPLQVIFEDEYLAVVYKPAGILVSGNRFKTVANALSQNIEQSNVIDATKPHPVHRLDYATTGVLLIGKTNTSIRLLNKMFENKEVKKVYYAVTIGEMKSKGEIILDIDGKFSKSYYNLVKTVPSKRFNKLNLVKLEPVTGRRHQLRKQLSAINNPILGDAIYGIENLILQGKGLYLHAYSLSFKHPFTDEQVCFKAEFPKRFKKIFPSKIAELTAITNCN
ncbi:RluA family pseudouridine synthase [Aureibaculum marinum]|uniref:RluA family pseudouridine synthase n=1 Tax=Aureibaculum marinum TaxID=2487930 RepID=UPI0026B5CC5E|nr:RluA family pseudouridine synthase [Aureibaculum marinum]